MTTVRMFGELEIAWSDGGAPRAVPLGRLWRLEGLLVLIWSSRGLSISRNAACDRIYGTEEKDEAALKRLVADYFPRVDGRDRAGGRQRASLEPDAVQILGGLRQSREALSYDPAQADVDVARFRVAGLRERLELYRDVFLPFRKEGWAEDLRAELEDDLADAITRRLRPGDARAPEADLADDVARLLRLYSERRRGRVVRSLEVSSGDSAKRLYLALVGLATKVCPGDLPLCRELVRNGSKDDDGDRAEILRRLDEAVALAAPPTVADSRVAAPPSDHESVSRFIELAMAGDVDGALRVAARNWTKWSQGTCEAVARPWLHRLVQVGSKDAVLQGEALVLLAGVCVDLRDFPAVQDAILRLQLLPRELWNAPTTNGRPLRARALTVVANYAAEMGYARAARECLARAAALLDERQHREVALILGANRESTYVDEGEPLRAIQGLSALLRAHRASPIVKSAILHNLGAAHLETLADLREARRRLEAAANIRKELTPNQHAQTSIDLARLEFYESNPKGAAELARRAVGVGAEVGASFPGAHLLLAACATKEGNIPGGRDELKKALLLVRVCRDPRRHAQLAEQTAALMLASGRGDEARALLRLADRLRNHRRRTPYEDWQRDSILDGGRTIERSPDRDRSGNVDQTLRRVADLVRTVLV